MALAAYVRFLAISSPTASGTGQIACSHVRQRLETQLPETWQELQSRLPTADVAQVIKRGWWQEFICLVILHRRCEDLELHDADLPAPCEEAAIFCKILEEHNHEAYESCEQDHMAIFSIFREEQRSAQHAIVDAVRKLFVAENEESMKELCWRLCQDAWVVERAFQERFDRKMCLRGDF